MPYEGERASKVSHQKIVENPTVAAFHAECDYLREPTPEEGAAMAAAFVELPDLSAAQMPERVVSIDGSWHEGSLDERLLPSTRIGYVQIGGVLIDLTEYSQLRVREGRFVDPFGVAKLDEHNDRLIFPIPSSNVTYRGQATVRASFRLAVEEHFAAESTWTRPGDPTSSLRGTLFVLAARRTGTLATGDPATLLLARCPNDGCSAESVPVTAAPGPQTCRTCGGPVYATDVLRIWENVVDFQPNREALGRLSNAVEHLLMVHYIRTMAEAGSLDALSRTAFVIDGPLALFGNMAWIHGPILDYLLSIRSELAGRGFGDLVVMGLQKTGQIADYARVMDRHVDNGRLLVIGDEIRYAYISPREGASVTFGLETHYGQDFLVKTSSGKWFPFALLYPMTKNPREDFVAAKGDLGRYGVLPTALRLLHELESDLYENATVPIVLAHRYTAISLVPGGRVLDVLSRQRMQAQRR
jgi:hypothetical protein